MMNAVTRFLTEVGGTFLELLLPTSLSRRILPQTEHFAPHDGTGFEGWYTRVQGEDFSMVIIICSLTSTGAAMERQNYLHFSIVPLRDESTVKERVEIHLFPRSIIPTSASSGSLPFTLEIPEFGVFTCNSELQTYNLRIPDDHSDCVYEVNLKITGRTPLDVSNPNVTPHGPFARLEHVLPLHWDIFSTCSDAAVEVTRRSTAVAQDLPVVPYLKRTARAHLEKNWSVSGGTFPQGWTWSQASTPTSSSHSSISLCLAGGMIFGNKASMIHYRSPLTTWSFAPPFTIILSFPHIPSILRRLGPTSKKSSSSVPLTFQWGPFASETYDNVRGALNVTVQSFTRKISINSVATEAPSTDKWLALYCPLPGGHSTTAYETFTATMTIQAYSRTWPFAAWTLIESHRLEDAALEFGGEYWNSSYQKDDDKSH